MKKYLSIPYSSYIYLEFKELFAYRINLFFEFFGSGIIVLIQYYLWKAAYSHTASIDGIVMSQMITYVLISGFIWGVLRTGNIQIYGEMIITGDLAIELLRPIRIPVMFLFRSAGKALTFLATRGIPILTVGFIFLKLDAPKSAVTIVYFSLSLILAFMIYFVLEFMLIQLTGVLETYWSLDIFWNIVIAFSTGQLIPIPFFPLWAQPLLFWLPFHAVFYDPIALFLSGTLHVGGIAGILHEHGMDIPHAILGEQMIWVLLLLPCAKLCWRLGKAQIPLQGG